MRRSRKPPVASCPVTFIAEPEQHGRPVTLITGVRLNTSYKKFFPWTRRPSAVQIAVCRPPDRPSARQPRQMEAVQQRGATDGRLSLSCSTLPPSRNPKPRGLCARNRRAPRSSACNRAIMAASRVLVESECESGAPEDRSHLANAHPRPQPRSRRLMAPLRPAVEGHVGQIA